MKMAESSSQIESIQNPRIAWEGCCVLLDINDGDRLVFSFLTSSSSLKIGKNKYSLRPLIGCPFGSLFQAEEGSAEPYLSRISLTAEEGNHENVKDDCQINVDSKDNRALIDNNTAQSLSGEDIDAMRREGATGDQIVKALISNSSTFEKKTLFSQEKYRIRKQKKYAPKVLLRRPFARSICEANFKKDPARIGFLRVDSLSLLLSMANVSAYSDVLVVDMVGGLLTGAVAERLGGTGYVINTYFGVKPYPMDIVGRFNFNNEIRTRIVQSPSSDIAESKISEDSILSESTWSSETQSNAGEVVLLVPSDDSELISREKNVQEESCPKNSNEQLLSSENGVPHSIAMNPRHLDGLHEGDASTVAKNTKLAKAGLRATPEAIKLWKENGFTNLIIAAPELDTWGTVQELLPLLAYSASFAIHHQYLQPLATCMHNLQSAKMAIGLQISEPWLREYQVLPSRTHPCMQMSGFGGYILSGIRICSSEAGQHNK